jgi:hypothetical protein
MSKWSVAKHIRSLEREEERLARRAEIALTAGDAPEPEPKPKPKRGPGRPKKVKAPEPLVEAAEVGGLTEVEGPS